MPSLFSRSNTKRTKPQASAFTTPIKGRDGDAGPSRSSTGGRVARQGDLGEFGTVPSSSKTLPARPSRPLTPPHSPPSPPILPPKYTFLPTRIPPPPLPDVSINNHPYWSDDPGALRAYGLLGGIGSKVSLGLEDVSRVLQDIGKELERRGLATPLLFSSQALELSQSRTKMLVQAYLDTMSGSCRDAVRRYEAFLRDLKFARDHELAWLLRWAMARIVRIKEATREVLRGVMEWEVYEEWRGRERAANYPADAFPFLSALLPSEVYYSIIIPLFHLLSRFATHSHLSGLTTHALSSLFAPLLFEIPTSVAALSSHATFVRAASATEHLLLAYIRSTANGKGGLGLSDIPSRLKDWVSGYPVMLASDADLARGGPRRGARVVRCERVSRVVRAYSKDLIVQGGTWAADVPVKWEAWDRIILKNRRGEGSQPKYSPAWRRRMAVKEVLPLPRTTSAPADLGRKMSYGRAKRPGQKEERTRSAHGEDDEARWGSLAGKEWSMFEEGGFDSPLLATPEEDDMTARLQFDLSESAKMSVAERRQTMDWTDFASPSGGFNRTDPQLNVSLSFAEPLQTSITEWPRGRDELHNRLHKSHKDSTPFAYDTTPRIGIDIGQDERARNDGPGRVYLEEAFVDCWADLMMGAGWIDREELTFKEANWVVIEYKARPTRPASPPFGDPLADPRTSDLYFLFEERIPVDYQIAVADPKQKKTFANLFSPRNKKRNTVVAANQRAGSGWEDTDFDRMLLHRQKTKKVTLTKPNTQQATVWHMAPDAGSPRSPIRRQRTQSSGHRPDGADEGRTPDGKPSFFRKNTDRVIRRVKTDEEQGARARTEREHELEFEFHSASGLSSGGTSPEEVGRRGKSEEKWMDILVANGARRMERQDALTPVPLASTNVQPPDHKSMPKLPPKRSLPSVPSYPAPPSGIDGEAGGYRDTSSGTTRRSAARSPPPSRPPPDPPIHPYHTPEASEDVESAVIRDPLEPLLPVDLVKKHPIHPYHTPETSDEVESTGEEATPRYATFDVSLERTPSWGRRKPVPAILTSPKRIVEHLDEPPDSPRSPVELDAPLDVKEIVAPAPQRDTIHNIVDTYNRDSTWSATGTNRSESDMLEDAEETEDDERLVPPPTTIFDLTPGREPSPARYRHGEPLPKVGEESEEE